MLSVSRPTVGFGKRKAASSSHSTLKIIIYGVWIALFGAIFLTGWAFTRSLNVHASEHSTGALRTRSLAAAGAPEDPHHGRLNPKTWKVEDNLEEMAAGKVHYGSEGFGSGGSEGGSSAGSLQFCKTEEDEGGSVDLYVQTSKVAITPVSYPLPEAVTAGHNTTCAWTKLQYKDLPADKVNICTYSPQVDTVISSSLHREGKWVGVLEWEALRAAGMCTKKRPFVIDVGAGFGSFSLMAAAAGCKIIAFEPHPPNMARLLESFSRNGFLENGTFIMNAIHRSEGQVQLYVESHNPGAARVVRKGGNQAQSTAGAITLRSFFQWANRPRNPYTGRKLSPSDIAVIRVDTEGHGLAVLDSLKEILAGGNPPVISVHYYPALSRNGVGCDAKDFLDFSYSKGYKFYLGKELWSKQRWYDYLEKETWSCQPMIVHKSLATTGVLNYRELAKFESQDP
jgi:FkbM family methyltransferase